MLSHCHVYDQRGQALHLEPCEVDAEDSAVVAQLLPSLVSLRELQIRLEYASQPVKSRVPSPPLCACYRCLRGRDLCLRFSQRYVVVCVE